MYTEENGVDGNGKNKKKDGFFFGFSFTIKVGVD